jgi:DNA-binding TFAR19-related protein (PDSD5 family)
MTLKEHIITRYGTRLHAATKLLKQLSLQIASSKNRILFLECCLYHGIVPKFYCHKCPISGYKANNISRKYQHDILRELLHQTRRSWRIKNKKNSNKKIYLSEHLSPQDFEIVSNADEKSYKQEFKKRSTKLRKRFDLLLMSAKPPPQRPSVVKKSTLELQTEALNSEECELLNLGPNFSITPSTIPYLDIACPIKSGASFLKSQGQHEDADLLRQVSCEILKKAETPKSNLTSRQRYALNNLRKKEGTSIAPFDKGKGFVVLNTEDLKQKAFQEMTNVSFNKRDGTRKLEKQVGNLIDRLHAKSKISDQQKTDIKPSDSIAPASWPAINLKKVILPVTWSAT